MLLIRDDKELAWPACLFTFSSKFRNDMQCHKIPTSSVYYEPIYRRKASKTAKVNTSYLHLWKQLPTLNLQSRSCLPNRREVQHSQLCRASSILKFCLTIQVQVTSVLFVTELCISCCCVAKLQTFLPLQSVPSLVTLQPLCKISLAATRGSTTLL